MAKVIGDIAIAVGADIAPLKREMGKGSKVVKGFGNDTAAMGKKIAKAGAVVATAAAAMGVAFFAAGKKAAAAAVEINNMSKIANSGTVEFQKMASAANTVNISQEKLADILKDVNDRIGDFVTTGGGPMKDFFEQIGPLVGVTADQFARLSGPEALQLYFTSLEKANLSQQEMTFFLEAMASDATALIPLLRNNGTEMKRLGDEALRSGRILDDELIQNGVKLDKIFTDLSDTISADFTRAILENAPALEGMAGIITEVLIPAGSAAAAMFADIADKMGLMNGQIAELNKMNAEIVANTPEFSNKKPNISNPLEGIPQSILDDFNQAIQMGDTALAEQIISPFKQGTGRGTAPSQKFDILELANNTQFDPDPNDDSRGGSTHALTDDDFEKLQDSFATESEILDEKFARDLERLEEFRASKLSTEEEFNDLEARIRKEHSDAQQSLEQKAMDSRLQMARGIFGGLAMLMRSENEKLFKIGKAAALSKAAINMFQGISEGVKLGWPLAIPAVAYAAATGAAAIAGIQSQSSNGGGGRGGGGGGAVGGAAAQPEINQSTLVNVSIQGDNFSSSGVRGLLESINDVIEDGGRIRLV